ncbi:MAG TPA: ribose-5-phosphate isomerase A, partial [Candidatus Bathyarchaeia archaeon]|nr:ribose-5-phosphate isomerase A [Candidatus Bathyarchaeia archaeon]
KLVDTAALDLAVVVDESKVSKHLGGKQSIPLEVLPLAYKYVQSVVARMGGRAKLRESLGKAGPVITDNGNFILDADFGKIQNAVPLERRLKAIPGILETGLFLGLTKQVYVGLRTGKVKVLKTR